MSTQFGDMLSWLGLNNTGVSAAIPGGIHPDKIPQTVTQIPFAWFAYASAEGPSSLSGAAAQAVEYTTINLFIRANDMTQKKAAADALRAAFASYGQGMVTINGKRFGALKIRGRSSSEESEANGNDESFRGWDYQITGWAVLV